MKRFSCQKGNPQLPKCPLGMVFKPKPSSYYNKCKSACILVFYFCFTRPIIKPNIAEGFSFPSQISRLTELSSKRNICIEPLF